MSKEQIANAAASGCFGIRFGVESGTKEIRKRMGRDTMTNEDMVVLAQNILDCDLSLYICSIIGVPSETPEMFEETYKVVARIYEMAQKKNKKCTAILNSYYPLHGTPLGDECYRDGIVNRDVYGISAHVDYALKTPYMSREFVLKQQQRFRNEFKGMPEIGDAAR
jgi:radical SAM superfamily enzyme YgiQ (UPF0313 family)